MQKLRSMQWNIGGGFTRDAAADKAAAASYDRCDLDYIIDTIRAENPDIITLQESHAKPGEVQAEIIAQTLRYAAWINDPYDQSHIDTSAKLCQSVISRFPITKHSFELFLNPNWTRTNDDGSTAHSHDKGMTTCVLDLGDRALTVQTLHAVPFGNYFSVDPLSQEAAAVRHSMSALMHPEPRAPYLLQGDFNINGEELAPLFPAIQEQGIGEFLNTDMTTPRGRRYDRVLYRGLVPGDLYVLDSTLTDHYPVIADFTI